MEGVVVLQAVRGVGSVSPDRNGVTTGRETVVRTVRSPQTSHVSAIFEVDLVAALGGFTPRRSSR